VVLCVLTSSPKQKKEPENAHPTTQAEVTPAPTPSPSPAPEATPAPVSDIADPVYAALRPTAKEGWLPVFDSIDTTEKVIAITVDDCYQGENLWGHGKIVILVNANTVSAGDHFTMAASAYPNVTVMGFTHSNGSCQGVNSVSFDYGILTYSGALLLNEDGSVFVDTDHSRKAVVPLDKKIPFDLQAVSSLFDAGEDYLLKKATEEFGK